MTKSGNSLLYRDSIYTFLHFQYNGFFTLSVFALFLNYAIKKGINIGRNAKLFSVFLCLSIVPALFLSLLWHNNWLFYVLAAIGCVLIIISIGYFFRFFRSIQHLQLFSSPVAKTLWLFAAISFGLKMLLNVGTIIPQLGDAVYGDRPIIIGFLYLVFLGFLTFYLLATLIEDNYFTRHNKIITYPFFVFSFGILVNEFLLMLQGLGILFKTNNEIFKWLLWGAGIVLFLGALLILLARLSVVQVKNHRNFHGF